MPDYTVPLIKENELLVEASMATVKEIRVVNTSDASKAIAKANFTLPLVQVIGPVGGVTSQITLESGLYYVNT